MAHNEMNKDEHDWYLSKCTYDNRHQWQTIKFKCIRILQQRKENQRKTNIFNIRQRKKEQQKEIYLQSLSKEDKIRVVKERDIEQTYRKVFS